MTKYSSFKQQQLITEGWRKYLNEEQAQSSKPHLVFLIGPPSTGKSYYTKNYSEFTTIYGSLDATNPTNEKSVLVNRDDILEQVAKQSNIGGGSYDDMFMSSPIHAEKNEELKNQFQSQITLPLLPPSLEPPLSPFQY